MHSSRELRSSSFEITVGDREVRLVDLFEGFGEQDRLGLVIRRPCGAVGASALITAAITAFYDLHRARGPDFFVYPDYFLFHVGGRLGDHGMLDVWPAHKEVVVGDDPEEILRAVNDRGVTRLVVPDGVPGEPDFERQTLASAVDRIATCLVYSSGGRAEGANVEIAGNETTESYVDAVLEASGCQLDRSGLLADGRPRETFRRASLDEGLALLSGQPVGVEESPKGRASPAAKEG